MSDISAGEAWSYRSGQWYAVFGPRVAVLLPPSQRDRVMAVWSLADKGAGFDEVLDRLLLDGLSTLPGLVVVGTEGGLTRVLVRGSGVTATVREGDEVVLDGASAGTWVEQSFAAVTSLTITVPADGDAAPGADDHTIAAGLVPVSRVDWPAYVEPASAASRAAGASGGVPALAVVPDVAEAWPAQDDVPTGHVEAIEEAAVAGLRFSDGQAVVVDRPVIIGRAPDARRCASTLDPTLVAVESRLNEISSTHVEIRPGAGDRAGSAVVTDMGSTNGTVLELPGEDPVDLKPGIAAVLTPGAVVNLGDGVTVLVTEP